MRILRVKNKYYNREHEEIDENLLKSLELCKHLGLKPDSDLRRFSKKMLIKKENDKQDKIFTKIFN